MASATIKDMETITKAQLQTILEREAKKDVGFAKKRGALIISDTKIGNVEIKYRPGYKPRFAFVVSHFYGGNILLQDVSAAAVQRWLVENYKLVMKDTVVVD